MNPKKLEDIAKQIHESLPPGIKNVGEEVEKKIKGILQAQLGKLDLVTRDEFEVQTRVLLRTREKLIEMESRIEQLEQKLEQQERD